PHAMRTVVRVIVALTLALAASAAPAQDARYPSRPIKVIVPFPPGGPIDVMPRLMSQQLSPALGTIVVENRPGGGSTVGLKAAMTAEPDGHTLLYGGMMTLSVIPSMSKSLDGEARGFAPVALVSTVPFVLNVATKVQAKDVQSFVAHAKANPGKLNFGAPAGATPLLVGELFKLKAGVDIQT